jgi:TetR/AcrR family transcriptional repressor of nem operon
MSREKQFDEAHVLQQAIRVFWARGYEGTSMNDLVEAMGINRGSIYATYTNKHRLFMTALRYYDRTFRKEFFNSVERRHAPKQAIVALFDEASRQYGTVEEPGGCMIVNSALELSPHDPEVRALADACFQEVEDFFASRIDAAQREGTIAAELDAGKTARALLCLFLGLRVLTRSTPHRATLGAITSQAKAMLE